MEPENSEDSINLTILKKILDYQSIAEVFPNGFMKEFNSTYRKRRP